MMVNPVVWLPTPKMGMVKQTGCLGWYLTLVLRS